MQLGDPVDVCLTSPRKSREETGWPPAWVARQVLESAEALGRGNGRWPWIVEGPAQTAAGAEGGVLALQG